MIKRRTPGEFLRESFVQGSVADSPPEEFLQEETVQAHEPSNPQIRPQTIRASKSLRAGERTSAAPPSKQDAILHCGRPGGFLYRGLLSSNSTVAFPQAWWRRTKHWSKNWLPATPAQKSGRSPGRWRRLAQGHAEHMIFQRSATSSRPASGRFFCLSLRRAPPATYLFDLLCIGVAGDLLLNLHSDDQWKRSTDSPDGRAVYSGGARSPGSEAEATTRPNPSPRLDFSHACAQLSATEPLLDRLCQIVSCYTAAVGSAAAGVEV